MELGEIDYREAGRERLLEAKLLLDADLFAGGIYLAGRAVECLLRALLWRFDAEIRTKRKSLDTGHDFRNLFDSILAFGILGLDPDPAELRREIQSISRLWLNNYRFAPTRKVKSLWWQIGAIGKKRTLKQAARDYYQMCSRVVEQCEAICENG